MVYGLACTASSPASMSVQVGMGGLFSLQNLDNTAYGSLAADTAHQISKDGYNASAQTLALSAPTTSGQSIIYLVEAAFSEADGSPLVLQYFNSSNPSQAWAGQTNSGTAQNTVRSNTCTIQAIPGTAAATGSQTAPATSAGYVPLYYVTVAYGATTITASNITPAPGAPFIDGAATGRGVQAGRLLNIQTFTANGTYTPTPGTNSIVIEVQGAGGGGGGAAAPTGGSTVPLSSGGSGGTFAKNRLVSGFSAGIPVSIGAAGAGGAVGATGGTGGTTSFGSLLSCPGGMGGTSLSGVTSPVVAGGGNFSGAATGAALFQQSGSPPTYGIALSTTSGAPSRGGDSFYGKGGQTASNTAGNSGSGFGAGGSGVFLINGDAVGVAGGPGTPGLVIVTEYS